MLITKNLEAEPLFNIFFVSWHIADIRLSSLMVGTRRYLSLRLKRVTRIVTLHMRLVRRGLIPCLTNITTMPIRDGLFFKQTLLAAR